MNNATRPVGVAPAKIPVNDPLLIAVRAAYTEVALGMKPNYDQPRKKNEAYNYEYIRLACREHIATYGALPNWKRNTKIPGWLSVALHIVRNDLNDMSPRNA